MRTVTTTKGLIHIGPRGALHKCIIDGKEVIVEEKHPNVDTDTEYTEVIELWLGDELIHRSAHVTIKSSEAVAKAESGKF